MLRSYFLSACQTTTSGIKRPDEAIYLAPGMLIARFEIWSRWCGLLTMCCADMLYARLIKAGNPSIGNPSIWNGYLAATVQYLQWKSSGFVLQLLFIRNCM